LKIALGFGEGSPVTSDLRSGELIISVVRGDSDSPSSGSIERREMNSLIIGWSGIVDDLRQVEKDCGKSGDFRVAPEVFQYQFLSSSG